jgi:hypothetical protein
MPEENLTTSQARRSTKQLLGLSELRAFTFRGNPYLTRFPLNAFAELAAQDSRAAGKQAK